MATPKEIFYVEILPGGTPLGFREQGGGHFTSEKHARDRYEYHNNRGRRVRLYTILNPPWVAIEEANIDAVPLRPDA